MSEHKHITAIVVVITAIAVALCFLAMGFSDSIEEYIGGEGVTMEYEYRLFNTDEPIQIDIRMDEDEWQDMLNNASAEIYYVCDVVINGQKLYNVAIRPKGNTSLSAIAMDPNNNRYSFKLEFDQYVKGQTCYGLDKLILNNNYADATNMKEAVIYDMFKYLGADASLYNYAVISVNGEYWGVYLALEAVEDSFILRNYGTEAGEMYKPDTLDFGGDDDRDEGDSEDWEADSEGREAAEDGDSNADSADSERNRQEGAEEAPAEGADAADGTGEENRDWTWDTADSTREENSERTWDTSDSTREENSDWTWDTSDSTREENSERTWDTADSTSEENGDWTWDTADSTGEDTERGDSDGEAWGDSEGEEGEDRGDSNGGGWGAAGGGANLNYTGDDLDNYEQIWASEITNTTEADHKRVVTALKNISEGNELEKYMDIDNLLRFMAVHVFSVNQDSLSANMAHNYYLYEYEGQLNMIPWDYNLALGGMGMGSSASDLVNDPIDYPFAGTKFFDTLLENDEYREKYHEYLRQLVEEYIRGGAFDETYNRIRNQIDALVETDPNAMYSYEQYEKAADMLYKVMNLRADSIEGQLDGTIPSTEEGQRQDSSALIDTTGINVSTMGSFSMGGFGGDREDSDGDSGGGEAAEDGSSGGRSSANEEAAPADDTAVADGESTGESSEENAEGESTGEWSAENAEGESTGEWAAANEDGESSGDWASDDGDSSGDRSSSWGSFGRTSIKQTRNRNIIIFAVCLGIAVIGVIVAAVFRRRR